MLSDPMYPVFNDDVKQEYVGSRYVCNSLEMESDRQEMSCDIQVWVEGG